MSGHRHIINSRWALWATALTMVLAFSAVGRNERGAQEGAVKLYRASVAEHASENRAVESTDSHSLLPALLLEDLSAAQQNDSSDELVIAELLANLVEIDSQAAARFAEHVTDARLREVLLRVVAQGWAHIDADSAALWATSLGDARERDQTILNVALGLAQSEPEQAVRLLERQFAADIPAGMLEGVVQQWAEQSYQDALLWSEALPQGAQRDLILQRLVFVRANQIPTEAARLAEEALADRQIQSDAFATVALSWGSRDPASAQEWARNLAGPARERVDAELALLGHNQP